jgi:hypothetical protein
MDDDALRALLRAKGYGDHICDMGPEKLVARWRDFVQSVAHGYPLGLDDYRNDLDLREAIAVGGLDREVRDADSLFRSLLTDISKRVWRSNVDNDFWNLGYPKTASGALLRDLRDEGVA